MSTEETSSSEPPEWFLDLPAYMQEMWVKSGLVPKEWAPSGTPYATPDWVADWRQAAWAGFAMPQGLAPLYAMTMATTAMRAGWLGDQGNFMYSQRQADYAATSDMYGRRPPTEYNVMQESLFGARGAYWGAQQEWAPIAELWGAGRLATYAIPGMAMVRAFGFIPYSMTQRGYAGGEMMPYIQQAIQVGGQVAIDKMNASSTFWPFQLESWESTLVSGFGEWTIMQSAIWGLKGGFGATAKATLPVQLMQAGLSLMATPLETLTLRRQAGWEFTQDEWRNFWIQETVGAGLTTAGIGVGLKFGFNPFSGIDEAQQILKFGAPAAAQQPWPLGMTGDLRSPYGWATGTDAQIGLQYYSSEIGVTASRGERPYLPQGQAAELTVGPRATGLGRLGGMMTGIAGAVIGADVLGWGSEAFVRSQLERRGGFSETEVNLYSDIARGMGETAGMLGGQAAFISLFAEVPIAGPILLAGYAAYKTLWDPRVNEMAAQEVAKLAQTEPWRLLNPVEFAGQAFIRGAQQLPSGWQMPISSMTPQDIVGGVRGFAEDFYSMLEKGADYMNRPATMITDIIAGVKGLSQQPTFRPVDPTIDLQRSRDYWNAASIYYNLTLSQIESLSTTYAGWSWRSGGEHPEAAGWYTSGYTDATGKYYPSTVTTPPPPFALTKTDWVPTYYQGQWITAPPRGLASEQQWREAAGKFTTYGFGEEGTTQVWNPSYPLGGSGTWTDRYWRQTSVTQQFTPTQLAELQAGTYWGWTYNYTGKNAAGQPTYAWERWAEGPGPGPPPFNPGVAVWGWNVDPRTNTKFYGPPYDVTRGAAEQFYNTDYREGGASYGYDGKWVTGYGDWIDITGREYLYNLDPYTSRVIPTSEGTRTEYWMPKYTGGGGRLDFFYNPGADTLEWLLSKGMSQEAAENAMGHGDYEFAERVGEPTMENGVLNYAGVWSTSGGYRGGGGGGGGGGGPSPWELRYPGVTYPDNPKEMYDTLRATGWNLMGGDLGKMPPKFWDWLIKQGWKAPEGLTRPTGQSYTGEWTGGYISNEAEFIAAHYGDYALQMPSIEGMGEQAFRMMVEDAILWLIPRGLGDEFSGFLNSRWNEKS